MIEHFLKLVEYFVAEHSQGFIEFTKGKLKTDTMLPHETNLQ